MARPSSSFTSDASVLALQEAAALAATVCRTVQRSFMAASPRFLVDGDAGAAGARAHLKPDRSPVTVADLASQAVVSHALTEALGRQPLVAEENAAMVRAQLAAGDTALAEVLLDAVRIVWPRATLAEVLDSIDAGASDVPEDGGFITLDPIDGTKGFLRGGQYAVSLAWIESARPVAGVLACPNLAFDRAVSPDVVDSAGCLVWATAGGGAFEAPLDAAHEVRALEPRRGSTRVPVRLCESVEAAHSRHDVARKVFARVGFEVQAVRLDSQAKYAVVARGQADCYLRLPSQKDYVEWIWDHAAGALIAAETGLVVTDAGGRVLDFGRGRRLEENRGILVAPRTLHGKLLAALREL